MLNKQSDLFLKTNSDPHKNLYDLSNIKNYSHQFAFISSIEQKYYQAFL